MKIQDKRHQVIRKLIFLAGVLFFLQAYESAAQSRVIKSTPTSLGASIAGGQRLSAPTIGHAKILMESDFFPPETVKLAEKTLNDIIACCRAKLPGFLYKASYTRDEVAAFAKVVHQILKEKGFSYERQTFLTDGLARRKVDCDIYSDIYQSIGDAIGFPNGIIIHTRTMLNNELHAMLRFYYQPGKFYNIETTAGILLPDTEYQKSKGAFFKELPREEKMKFYCAYIAICLQQRGIDYYKQKNFQEALNWMDKALNLAPGDANLKHNRDCCVFALQELSRKK